MVQQINVAGVGVLSFPDGMSDSDISAAIHKNFPQLGPPPGAAKAGVGDIPKDPGQYSNSYFDIPSMSMKERPNDGLDTFMEGLGRHLASTVTGVKQLAQKIGNKAGLGNVLPDQYGDAAVARTQKDVDSAATTDKPLLASTPGMLGNAAGSGALMSAAPGGVLASAAAGAADQGAQPVQTGGPGNVANAALGAAGGAGGALVGKAVGALVQPIKTALSSAQNSAVQILRSAGIPLSAFQQTGSRLMKTAENAAADSPLFGPSALPGQQADASTKAALAFAGVDSDTASPAVMQKAKKALGATYDAIAARNSIAVNLANPTKDPLLMDLNQISLQAKQSLTPDHYSVINNQLDNVVNAIHTGNGQINGTQYANIQQALDRVAGDGGKQPFVTDIRQALTAALKRSSNPQDVALLSQTDSKYQALKQIQKAIGPDNKVSLPALYNVMDTTRNANQAVYGQGQQGLMKLAQAGRVIFGNKTPNSGTTQRMAGQLALGSAIGAGVGYHEGNTSGGTLAGIAMTLGGPGLARAVTENPRVANAIARYAASRGLLGASQAVQGGVGAVGAGIGASGAGQIAQPDQNPQAVQ